MRRSVLLAGIGLWLGLCCLRIRYVRLGWGGYWTVELAAPWER